jgi:uncharacterized protein YjbI with pentapeptide repeats
MVDASGQLWEPDWPRCAADICIGARVEGHDWCLAHLDDRGLREGLARLRPQASIDARGTAFTEELLDRFLAAVKDADGVPMLGEARFDRAFFDGHARFHGDFFGAATFHGAEFRGDATFVGSFQAAAVFTEARFRGRAKFDGVRFAAETWFDRARFSRDARFNHASFNGLTHFDRAQFEGGASFQGTKFRKAAWFSDARFGGIQLGENSPVQSADFTTSEFHGLVEFHMARFDGDATFQDATFTNPWFHGAQFHGDLRFNSARFGSTERLGPIVVAKALYLDRAVFDQAVQIEATAAGVVCTRVTFAKHATLRLRHAATVLLDETTADGPLTMAAAAEPFTAPGQAAPMDEAILDRTMIQQAEGEVAPRLVSLAGVDASQLVLTDVDLSHCYFAGAHHLDQLHLEGRCRFTSTPVGWKLWGWPPLWHWTRRQTIAEEHLWRAADRARPVAWPAPPPPSATPPARLDPEHLAARYRQLRKAQEDAKNEPGAADFYYGEMEMRRRDGASAAGERIVLAVYWLVAGYGLRASRALAAMLILLALGTTCFAWFGFAPSEVLEYRPIGQLSAGRPVAYQQAGVPGPRPGWAAALDQSLDSATSLLRAPQPRPLTIAGRAVEIALRLLGPLLLGLAVLAVRNRVKR